MRHSQEWRRFEPALPNEGLVVQVGLEAAEKIINTILILSNNNERSNLM